ncbi:hypothetical protein [Candidatus Ruminimicrobium bovinum]|uniref:hypothetical protein n=1 Tax=Candidatus Ruminimicrobium bovinum TaxID=3242779 RepID=UPI0039B9680D
MILFSISLIFLLLYIIFNKSAKANNILGVLAFIFICFVYVVLVTNSTKPEFFYPKKQLQIYPFTGNYYNWLTINLTKFKLDLGIDEQFINDLTNNIDKSLLKADKVDISVKMLYDTSIYKNKVYLYFGLTPVILFYLPFYLATKYFISDHIIVLILSIFIFLLHILIYRKILNLLNRQNYFTVIPILIFGLASGIVLTYVSITIHLIPILTSVFCSLTALYVFLLLSDAKYKNLKMFLIGLFLALAIGARPISIILAIFIFIAILIMDSKKYIYNFSKFQNFQSSNLIKKYLCFFVPLIIYGIILALYNYFRFDSIFNFGYTYQFSPIYQKGFAQNLNHSLIDFIKHIFLNLFHLPVFTSINPLCVFKNYENVSYFEPMIGGFIIYPIVIFILFIKNFLTKTSKKNKNIHVLFIIMLSVGFIYFLINSYIGSNARFVAEYLSLLLVPSLVLFYNLIEIVNNDILKNIIKFLFLCFIIFSLYVNTNLINCIILMSKNGLI